LRTIDIKSFFKTIGYSWKKDEKSIQEICYYTKSRARKDNPDFYIVDTKNPSFDIEKTDFRLSSGMEQPFLIKSIADWKKSRSFFEIGTGRGTACYATSLSNSIESIDTVDIIPFDYKRSEAIGYSQSFVSNKDLYEMISFKEKSKISFYERKDLSRILPESKKIDLFFIDGNHTDQDVILEDFQICKFLSSESSVIIWDDYYPDKFAIKDSVHTVMKNFPQYEMLLIESRGHLFEGKEPERECGTIIMAEKGVLAI